MNASNNQETFTPYSKYVDLTKIEDDWISQPASPSTVTNTAILPTKQTKKNIKSFLKEKLFASNHDIRSVLYKNLIKRISCNTSMFSGQMYADFLVEEMDKDSSGNLPPFIKNKKLTYHYLNKEGKTAMHNILLCIANNFPHITYCPMLTTIVVLLLHYDDSETQVFENTCRILFSNTKFVHYIDVTKPETEASALLFKDLVVKYAPASHKSLLQFTQNPDAIYGEWRSCMFTYLPFSYIVILFDMYLLEGYKALYRMSVTILKFYRKLGLSDHTDILNSVFQFVKSLDSKVSAQVIFRKAFNLKLPRSKELKKLHHKQMCLLNHLPIPEETHEKQRYPWNYLSLVRHVESDIANETLLSTLYCWIPERIALGKPKCIFSTNKHGCFISSFYQAAMDVEPTLLLIKTFNDEVIGAYCSSAWNNDSQHTGYFGTGETFLFSLQPEASVYYWPGAKNYSNTPECFLGDEKRTQSSVKTVSEKMPPRPGMLPPIAQNSTSKGGLSTASSEERETGVSLPPIVGKSIKPHTPSISNVTLTSSKTPVELFMLTSDKSITVGGGNGFGLQLDETLLNGVTETCDTFLNDPLVSSGYFKCATVELISFEI